MQTDENKENPDFIVKPSVTKRTDKSVRNRFAKDIRNAFFFLFSIPRIRALATVRLQRPR